MKTLLSMKLVLVVFAAAATPACTGTLNALTIDSKSAAEFGSPLEGAVSCAAMLELAAVANAPGLAGVANASTSQQYEAALGAAFDQADAQGLDVEPGSPLDDLDIALAYRHNARDELNRTLGLSSRDTAQDATVASMVASIKASYAENGITGDNVLTLLSKTVERCRSDADSLS
ncbi:MAG: hypothetical protein QNJ05_15635 [Woeseiaceae bacterium]|nr:hypothetical protein [Woeseiaceae bacterium]